MARIFPSETYYEFCGPRHVCAYCGEPADNVDHTIPRALVAEKPVISRCIKLMKVSSCGECNRFASNTVHETFFERRMCIARKITKKYSFLLKYPPWSKEEIDEMGRGIKSMINEAKLRSDWIRGRLSILRSPVPPVGVRANLWERKPFEYGDIEMPVKKKTEATFNYIKKNFEKRMDSLWVPTSRPLLDEQNTALSGQCRGF